MTPTLFLVVFASLICVGFCLNNRPVIGILAQPYTSNYHTGPQYIAASYVKWIESSGARVVPILYGTPTDELQKIFSSINGLLLPGGGTYLGADAPYYKTLKTLWDWIITANTQGDYFPVWGTCFGFEELNILVSQNVDILQSFDSENYTVHLNFTSNSYASRLFGQKISWIAGSSFITDDILKALATKPIAMNNHRYGISPTLLNATPALNQFFTILSTNNDRNGKTFVSSFESKVLTSSGKWSLPIYGTQYHPEKPQFEWDPYEVIQHTTDAIWANQYHGNFFVRECRQSTHTFESENELVHKYLIYNWAPVYSYLSDPEFEQSYVFQNPTVIE